ncbi:MAG: cysteine desulfurase [Bacteroidota bacterium]|nr:cysteine desulfurase [Bacteroidota bacterium]
MSFQVNKIREDFPILDQLVYKHKLVYFDNAATTQKPRQVIDAVKYYYEHDNCNIHRGVHFLSQRATGVFEDTRSEIKQFINAASPAEIIFTKGTTESINLVAHSFGKKFLSPGDEILISVLEHHSNFVPWQEICKEQGAILKFIPLDNRGDIDMEVYKTLLNEKTRLVAIAHSSNVLGAVNPVAEIIRLAHLQNIPVLVDGAQAIAHLPVDVQKLDCDFYCFSGHKMYAPMGIGVLYGKEKWLEEMPPYQTGGEMIQDVFFDHTTFNELPYKFEAGTPNVEGVYGLREAIHYLQKINMNEFGEYEKQLVDYTLDKFSRIKGLKVIGNPRERAGLISFLLEGIHPYDAGTLIDKMGIAVRTGHHCAMPLMEYLKIPGTIRASYSFYNTFEEIDRLAEALETVKKIVG